MSFYFEGFLSPLTSLKSENAQQNHQYNYYSRNPQEAQHIPNWNILFLTKNIYQKALHAEPFLGPPSDYIPEKSSYLIHCSHSDSYCMFQEKSGSQFNKKCLGQACPVVKKLWGSMC